MSTMFEAASAATSTEDIGNPVHHGTRGKLEEHRISCDGKVAVQLKKDDYIIGMDSSNCPVYEGYSEQIQRTMSRGFWICSPFPRDIADPWYTGDFDKIYDDILTGCTSLLEFFMG